MTREDAGYEIRASESKISRLELGRVGFKERDVADLLTLYGVADDEERAALLTMAREANTPGWWHNYSDVLPGWFQAYVGLEEAAALIRTYEVQFVPGLLQTEDYARAVISQGQADAPKGEIDRRVGLRMARQRLFDKPNAPLLWAVLDESALRRPLGGPQVMRDQLAKLIAVTDFSNVTLQIMPFPFGGHPAESGAFSILRFPELDLPDVVYLEQLTGALYLDKRDEVDQYLRVIESLAFESTTPKQTLDTLTAMRDQL